MKKKDNLLLKSFFIIGVSDENRQKIMENKLKNDPIYAPPEILSSFSLEEETPLFTSIKDNLTNNNDLRNNIFPMKTDYLDIIISPDFDEEKIKDLKKVFSDYIIQTKENNTPEHCYHCFQYELDRGTGYDLVLNFGVLIFYENINTIELNEKEKDDININNDINNIFLGKALVLISDKPIFSLMKKILEKIYFDFIKPKYSPIYLESIIINLFDILNNDITKIIFKNPNNEKKEKEEENIDYNFAKDSILPLCDLNIGYFLQMFDINDILLIAEYYFLTKSIIIISPDCELLYPIYHILMTLFFPLNFHLKYYFYKLLYPDLLITGLCSPLPCFYFIYTNKNNNNGHINKDIIKKMTEDKKEILIFQITKEFDTDINKIKFNIQKNIYLYDDEEGFSTTDIKIRKNNTMIENVMKNINEYGIYTAIIKSNIDNITKNISKDIDNNFFDFSFDLNSFDIIRKNFLGLIIKFLVIKIEPLTFRLNDEGKLEICPLIMDEENDENDENLENTKNKDKNEKLKDFLEDSPQTELIYKNEIIKFNFFDVDYLKTQILLDYFIKMSKNDPNTLYFDENNINEENNNNNDNDNNNNNNKIVNIREIEFDKLFDYKKFMKSGKSKVTELKKDDNNYEIMSLSNLKKYIDIDIDKVKKKFGKKIKSVIFYNEDFKLNFDNFYFLESELNLKNHKNILSFYKINDIIAINNQDKIKYYYLILYEAIIFKKIFYTINTVNRKELAACATGLYLSLYLINLLTEKTKNKEKNKNLDEYFRNLFDKLFTLFTRTKCFYGKYNFITTLIYLILIINQPLKIEYIERFIYSLQELKNVPSLILILLYNNNIEFNLINDDNNQKFSEKKILYLEKIKHIHPFDIDSLSGYFICKNEECQEYMWFNIVNNIKHEKVKENGLNPIYLIKKILNKIEEKNSLIIEEIDNIDDIQQIAIWDEIYFEIRFFRDDYMDEIEY